MIHILIILLILSLISIGGSIILMAMKPKYSASLRKYAYILYMISMMTLLSKEPKEITPILLQLPYVWSMVFLGSIFSSLQHWLDYLGIDIVFKYINKGAKCITWDYAVKGNFGHNTGVEGIEYRKIGAFENTLIYKLKLVHPKHFKFYYNQFDKLLEVIEGEIIVNYKGGQKLHLKSGDFVQIERKQIHELLTITDAILKITCIK